MDGKAKVMLSKAKYFQFEAALHNSFDSDSVKKITEMLQATFNFDPNASQYDTAQAQRIANYRKKVREQEQNRRMQIQT